MANLRGYEILIIAVLILLLFGAKKLPDMARSIGKSARILKTEAKQMKKEGPGDKGKEQEKSEDSSEESSVPRTIQAAPGDVSDARSVDEQDKVER